MHDAAPSIEQRIQIRMANELRKLDMRLSKQRGVDRYTIYQYCDGWGGGYEGWLIPYNDGGLPYVLDLDDVIELKHQYGGPFDPQEVIAELDASRS